jgi:hypothetical protein
MVEGQGGQPGKIQREIQPENVALGWRGCLVKSDTGPLRPGSLKGYDGAKKKPRRGFGLLRGFSLD